MQIRQIQDLLGLFLMKYLSSGLRAIIILLQYTRPPSGMRFIQEYSLTLLFHVAVIATAQNR